MKTSGLFIFVEGDYDARFFNSIVKPVFEARYNWVKVIPYAKDTQKKINKFFKSIAAMNASYIFVADLDLNPCITAKKQKAQEKYQQIDAPSILVVVPEIESWYLAGLDAPTSQKLGLPAFDNTDKITKEAFNRLQPGKFTSKIDFTIELLKHYSVETARKKNASFRYFAERYNL